MNDYNFLVLVKFLYYILRLQFRGSFNGLGWAFIIYYSSGTNKRRHARIHW